MVTNHASSFMIMCEAFRTPEHIKSDVVRKRPDLPGIVTSNSGSGSSRVPSAACSSASGGNEEPNEELSNLLHVAYIQQSIEKGIMFGHKALTLPLEKTTLPLPLR